MVVVWLAFLRILEVPDSSLDPEVGYFDWSFSRFSSVPPEVLVLYLKVGHGHFFHILFNSLLTDPVIRRSTYSQIY
jgi:hypothetical protein